MNQFKVFLVKEWRDYWRSFKWIWIPLVFLVLGISDPIMNYFMEDIMSSIGNLPEDFIINFPEYTAIDIYTATTGQFQTIGVIIFTVVAASAISRERQQGTVTLLYVRPISYVSYFLSKWVMLSLLAVASVIIGYVGSLYYTTILYGSVPLKDFLTLVGTYCIWAIFVVTFSLAMSACFKTSISITISLIGIPIMIIIDSLIGEFWKVSPWKLPNYGIEVLAGTVDYSQYGYTLVVTLLAILFLIAIGIWMSDKRAYLAKL